VLHEQYINTLHAYPKCRYVFHKEGKPIGDFRKAWDTALKVCGFRPAFKCRTCRNEVELEVDQQWKIERHVVSIREGKDNKWEEIACTKCKGSLFSRNHKIFHDNRRTAIRNLVRTGTPEGVAMKISGHKTRTIFERYNIVSETDLRQASERLAKAHEKLKKVTQTQNGHILGTIALVK
jgi:hypothetical protein